MLEAGGTFASGPNGAPPRVVQETGGRGGGDCPRVCVSARRPSGRRRLNDTSTARKEEEEEKEEEKRKTK